MAPFTPQVIAQRTKVVVVAAIIMALAVLCQVIAVVTPGWLCSPSGYIGLFLYCGSFTLESNTGSIYKCSSIAHSETPESLQAVRVLSVISCALTLASFISCCLHLWLVTRHETIHNKVITSCVVLALAAVLVSVVTSILFGARTKHKMPSDLTYDYDLFYSYALYVAGGLFTILGAGVVVASVKSLTRLLFV